MRSEESEDFEPRYFIYDEWLFANEDEEYHVGEEHFLGRFVPKECEWGERTDEKKAGLLEKSHPILANRLESMASYVSSIRRGETHEAYSEFYKRTQDLDEDSDEHQKIYDEHQKKIGILMDKEAQFIRDVNLDGHILKAYVFWRSLGYSRQNHLDGERVG